MMLGSQQYALASVLMSSTFSVRSFSKDAGTLQAAADALMNYMWMGLMWTLSNVFVLGATYGTTGFISALVSNGAIMSWMWCSYMKAFKIAQDTYGLQPPKLL